MFALFINAAILIMAAATFHGTGHQDVAEIGDAYQLLSPLLGTTMASILFAVALLCSGQNATLTGTLAGQIVMEGFINLRLRPWLRRLITRLIAIVPAIIVIALYGERGTDAADHPQPGGPQPAAAVCRLSAGDVHERSAQDGAVREPALGEDPRVVGCGYHRRAERVAAVPDVRAVRCCERDQYAMYRRILVADRELAGGPHDPGARVEAGAADGRRAAARPRRRRLGRAQLQPAQAARVRRDEVRPRRTSIRCAPISRATASRSTRAWRWAIPPPS